MAQSLALGTRALLSVSVSDSKDSKWPEETFARTCGTFLDDLCIPTLQLNVVALPAAAFIMCIIRIHNNTRGGYN